jgi:hypothetical protein
MAHHRFKVIFKIIKEYTCKSMEIVSDILYGSPKILKIPLAPKVLKHPAAPALPMSSAGASGHQLCP